MPFRYMTREAMLLVVVGRDTHSLVKTAREPTYTRPNSCQTRSAFYVLPYSEQKGKWADRADPSYDPQEQCAPRHPLESSPIFGQLTGGKQALETDQSPVTHNACVVERRRLAIATSASLAARQRNGRRISSGISLVTAAGRKCDRSLNQGADRVKLYINLYTLF
jgi:hypothetical protein